MPATSPTRTGSCLPAQASVVGTIIQCLTASVFDRSDQKKPFFTHSAVPPRGCRVKQTAMCLFTMSKDPVADTSQCQHNQTCSLFLRRIFGSFVSVMHRAVSSQFPEQGKWWSQTGSNRRHPACKAGALPAELWPRQLRACPRMDERSEDPANRLAPRRRIRLRHSSGFSCVMTEPVRSVRQTNGGPG